MTGSGEPLAGDVSFDDVLGEATAVTKRCRICLRGDLVDELERLQIDLAEAQALDRLENAPDKAPAIAARIVELTDLARASEREFVFQSIGRRAWRDLVALHPPTDDEQAKGIDFNRETLPVAAMAASCISPKGATVNKFEALRDGAALGDAQWNRLWLTCRDANAGGADIPLSEDAYAMVRGIDSKRESPATTESLAASS